MNEVPLSHVWNEVQETGFYEIFALMRHLFAKREGRAPLEDDSEWEKKPLGPFRYASSIAIRSEVELLGMSTPRFAFRIYLNPAEDELQFINCRRLGTLQSHIDSYTANATPLTGKPLTAKRPKEIQGVVS